nr:hypothetical protein [Tanacetum cinerariifolium]
MADPIVITDYIGMPTYCGRMYLSEKTLAMLESQPIRPSDTDLRPTEDMMDIEQVFLPKKTPEQLKAQAASAASRLAAAKAALKA